MLVPSLHPDLVERCCEVEFWCNVLLRRAWLARNLLVVAYCNIVLKGWPFRANDRGDRLVERRVESEPERKWFQWFRWDLPLMILDCWLLGVCVATCLNSLPFMTRDR